MNNTIDPQKEYLLAQINYATDTITQIKLRRLRLEKIAPLAPYSKAQYDAKLKRLHQQIDLMESDLFNLKENPDVVL